MSDAGTVKDNSMTEYMVEPIAGANRDCEFCRKPLHFGACAELRAAREEAIRTGGGRPVPIMRSGPAAPTQSDAVKRLRELVHESLFHLRLDDRAKLYHEKAVAALDATEALAQSPATAVGEVERLREALRPFPMQNGPSIPWALAEWIYAEGYRFSSQSLERVAERGGFGWAEVAHFDKENRRRLGEAKAKEFRAYPRALAVLAIPRSAS
jgi:hypothetical protein